jgi:hypothetical protein
MNGALRGRKVRRGSFDSCLTDHPGTPRLFTERSPTPDGNYNRILLSTMLAGVEDAEEIFLNPLEWYRDNNIGTPGESARSQRTPTGAPSSGSSSLGARRMRSALSVRRA